MKFVIVAVAILAVALAAKTETKKDNKQGKRSNLLGYGYQTGLNGYSNFGNTAGFGFGQTADFSNTASLGNTFSGLGHTGSFGGLEHSADFSGMAYSSGIDSSAFSGLGGHNVASFGHGIDATAGLANTASFSGLGHNVASFGQGIDTTAGFGHNVASFGRSAGLDTTPSFAGLGHNVASFGNAGLANTATFDNSAALSGIGNTASFAGLGSTSTGFEHSAGLNNDFSSGLNARFGGEAITSGFGAQSFGQGLNFHSGRSFDSTASVAAPEHHSGSVEHKVSYQKLSDSEAQSLGYDTRPHY